MMDANAFLKRMLLVGAISALSIVNVAYAHGGGGKGTGGSSGSGSGGSSSSSSGGHSPGSTSVGHSATASKGSHSARDPVNVSQSAMVNPTYQQIRVYRIFQQPASTGYTTQYREINNDDWRRKHQRLFLGFIRY